MVGMTSAFAQMSRPSVFPEMRSYNPAVISYRKSGDYKLAVAQNNIEKKQNFDFDGTGSFTFKEDSDISLTNANFFRAGKGGGFTSEFIVDYTTGSKESKITETSGTVSKYETDTTSLFSNLSFGFANGVGLGLTHVSYESSYSFNGSIHGQAINENQKSEVSVLGVKPGIVFGGKNGGLGLTFEYQKYSTKGSSGAPSSMMFVGIAASVGSDKTLIEVAAEISAKELENNLPGEKAQRPIKFSFLTEMKLSFITVGYKLNAYSGGFIELDKVIQAQLIYSGGGDETRLEHIVNFSFGGDKGFNFGLSGGFSSSSEPEKNGLFFTTRKHATETTEISVAAKIGFVY